MWKHIFIAIIWLVITSAAAEDDPYLIMGKMILGTVEPNTTLKSEFSNKLADKLKDKYNKDCSNGNDWSPRADLPSKSLSAENIKTAIKNNEAHDYQTNKKGHSCYFGGTPKDVPKIIDSYTLTNIRQLIWYYMNIRLPLEVEKVPPPESYVYAQMNYNFQELCPAMRKFKELPLDALNDPVSMFPFIINLGKSMKEIIEREGTTKNLSTSTTIHNYKLAYLANPHLKEYMEHKNEGHSQFPLDAGLSDAIRLSYLQRYFHSVTTIIPQHIEVETLVPDGPVAREVSHKPVDPGSIFFRAETPKNMNAIPSKKELKEWDGYYKTLKEYMDKNLKGKSRKPSPYLMGLIDEHKTQEFIEDKGFHDQALYGGNILHGTASHVLQLFHLQQAGMPLTARKIMPPECWIWTFDRTSTSTWYMGFGIEYNGQIHAFHDMPTLGAPDVVHKVLTERLVSKIIHYMINHDEDKVVMEHFQLKWLGLKKVVDKNELRKLLEYARAIENIIIAEHIGGWTRIINQQNLAIVTGESAATGDTFDKAFTALGTKEKKKEDLESKGYETEITSNGGYIFRLRSYESTTRIKESKFLEHSQH